MVLKSLTAWPWAPALLVVLGLALTGVPEHMEGPTLVVLGSKHGLTLSNAVAFVLLFAGSGSLGLGAWRHLDVILTAVRTRPLPIALLLVQLSVGVLFLLASGASTMLRWWAPGVLLSVMALLGLAAATSADRT